MQTEPFEAVISRNVFPKNRTQIAQAAFELIFCARAASTKMDLSEWEGYSFELARALVSDASRCIANADTSLRQKSRAMELVLGFNWTKKSIRAVGAARISGLAQRAMRLNCTKDLARKWRAWLHKLWFAPPELSVEHPHKWRNVIATTGLGGRASEEQWTQLLLKNLTLTLKWGTKNFPSNILSKPYPPNKQTKRK